MYFGLQVFYQLQLLVMQFIIKFWKVDLKLLHWKQDKAIRSYYYLTSS